MTHRLLVLSDIDGTLVPHPFLSGLPVAARREFFDRMLALFRCPNFGFVTGRRKEGFLRFFSEYSLPEVWPSILAVENGMHLAMGGKWILERPQNPLIEQVVAAIRDEVESIPEMNEDHDTSRALASGRIETYYLELKRCCAQIEVHFSDPELRNRFLRIVERHANPHLVAGLTAQCFLSEGRLDLWEAGLVPKAGFWDALEPHLPGLGVAPLEKLTVLALGDEVYDSYLFAHLHRDLGARLERVVTVSVSRRLPWATHHVSGVAEALTLVERALGAPDAMEKWLDPIRVQGGTR